MSLGSYLYPIFVDISNTRHLNPAPIPASTPTPVVSENEKAGPPNMEK